MNTLEALQARRSVRGYADKPVEPEKLKTVLKYGNKAPNAGPFHMSVIRDRALLEELCDAAAQAVMASDNEFLRSRYSLPGYRATYGAPVVIMLSAPAGGYGAVNAACAVTNMCAAAAELGLGTCYLAGVLMAFKARPELAERLKMPQGYAPMCGMCLGYPGGPEIAGTPWKESYENVSYID